MEMTHAGCWDGHPVWIGDSHKKGHLLRFVFGDQPQVGIYERDYAYASIPAGIIYTRAFQCFSDIIIPTLVRSRLRQPRNGVILYNIC